MTALSERPRFWQPLLLGGALGLGGLLAPSPAAACGGFFCQATNPVNQAAERIIFAKEELGKVTAVIEIKYQGPSQNFSWLLPVSGVPEKIGLASTSAFDLLQGQTNPQYNLTVSVEGTCASNRLASGGNTAVPGVSLGGEASGDDHGGVTVEASGVVGAFEWTVISLDASLAEPAEAAVKWLKENGYDVPQGAPGLLGPYLADGLNLLALKLKKGASTGSIRPIVLTYDSEQPMIPIKLTAVAANENMGVLAWVLGEARAVPVNYYALELNEARINWFAASTNYGDVVNAAADDAGGQGFVTEMAGSTIPFKELVWSSYQQQGWDRIQQDTAGDALAAYRTAIDAFGGSDGLAEAAFAHAKFDPQTTVEMLKDCIQCYPPSSVDGGFVAALRENVVEPLKVVQDLLDRHPQLTRLYTTMSASEMTVDPLFSFNRDLPAVNNIHSAQRIIECSSEYYQDTAPWRIELPSGGVIRSAGQAGFTWPAAFASQPANLRILRAGTSGPGDVLEDNGAEISAALKSYSDSFEAPPPDVPKAHSAGGCTVANGSGTTGEAWAALLGALLLLKRRR
jgi:Uncharacterized protein conserved in bacteria (DUF2330)